MKEIGMAVGMSCEANWRGKAAFHMLVWGSWLQLLLVIDCVEGNTVMPGRGCKKHLKVLRT